MKEILFYCDNPSEFFLHRHSLEELNYDTSLRVSTSECMDIIDGEAIHALIIDLESTEGNVELIKSFIGEVDNIIIASDFFTIEMIDLFNDYNIEMINKPFKIEDLVSIIESFDTQEDD